MVNRKKKILSLILVFAMVFNYFIPLHKVFAAASTTKLSVSYREGNVGNGKAQYSLNDGASWIDVADNANEIQFSVTGDNLKIRIVTEEGYSVDYTGIELKQDGTNVADVSTLGLATGQGYSVPSNVQTVSLENLEFTNEGAPEVYTNTAHVSVNVIGTEIENPYGEDASEIRISVNNGPFAGLANNNVTNTYDEQDPEKIYRVSTVNPMDFGYNPSNNGKVIIGVKAQWNTYLTDVIINNQSYADQLPKTKDELIAIYSGQELRFYFEVPKDDNDNYVVTVEGRKQTDEEEIMGNFLWDYNENGYTGPGDKIYHSTLQFIKAEYGNQVFNNVDDLNAAGGLYHWRDAEKKEVYTNDAEGVGEATFPTGTMLTVAIIPDAGYQLVSFGVNDGGFAPQEQIGVYTFEIEGGNFHLQAKVESVENAVNAENSNAISAGSIELGGQENSMSVGTARLDIEDNDNLTANQTQAFENAAEDYEIQGVFDVSLFNTVFKGSRTASWDTPVDELDNDATITLGMVDDLSGKDIIVIHETHDGQYEKIDVQYDEEHNAISFVTDSFSNYAIATKGEDNNQEEQNETDPPVVKHTVDFNTNGGSEVPSVEIEHGKVLERPTEPTKDGYTFGGWYVEPELNYSYDFEGPVEGDFTLNARWIDNNDLKDYTVTNDDGNSISFTDEEGHNYKLTMFDILSMSKEDLMAMNPGMTEDDYNNTMTLLDELASQTGSLLKLYEIEVYEDNATTGDTTELHEGPFQIKIKITDEMKEYNSFKLVYLKNDFTLGEIVDLEIDGDYLIGTVPHLSTYMLTGSTEVVNPSTYDNIMFYVTMLTISTIGLLGVGLYIKKKNY